MKKNVIKSVLIRLYLAPRQLLALPIRLYRRFISPLKGGPTCRFTPSCSEYALEAIAEWGFFVGGALSVWRILRCNPFGGCGHDPVPKKKKVPFGNKDEQSPDTDADSGKAV